MCHPDDGNDLAPLAIQQSASLKTETRNVDRIPRDAQQATTCFMDFSAGKIAWIGVKRAVHLSRKADSKIERESGEILSCAYHVVISLADESIV